MPGFDDLLEIIMGSGKSQSRRSRPQRSAEPSRRERLPEPEALPEIKIADRT